MGMDQPAKGTIFPAPQLMNYQQRRTILAHDTSILLDASVNSPSQLLTLHCELIEWNCGQF